MKTIYYLGPEMSFTHLAARKEFGNKYIYKPASIIDDVFYKVNNDKRSIGVVPIENIGGGTIEKTAREIVSNGFCDSGMTIQNEIELEINLYVQAGDNVKKIKRIYSHPFPLQMCKKQLQSKFDNVLYIEKDTTTAAVLAAKADRQGAAIASKEAANYYKLKIITECPPEKYNVTRFLVIGHRPARINKNKKIKTIVRFSIPNKPGTLVDVLGILKKANINMTRILSVSDQVAGNGVWQYGFLIEIDGHDKNPRIKNVFKKIGALTDHFRVIASYPYKTFTEKRI